MKNHRPRIAKRTTRLAAIAIAVAAIPLQSFCADLVDFVDPFTGTAGGSKGSCFPSASVPFGMVKLAPLTGGGTNGYSYNSATARGFTFTRFSGTGGTPGMGNLLVTPLAGDPADRVGGWIEQAVVQDSETAAPQSYSLSFADGILAELTAGDRIGLFRFTFPDSQSAHVVIDAGFKLGGRSTKSKITLLDDRHFEGWMLCNSIGGTRADAEYRIYFHGAFDHPFQSARLWQREVESQYTEPTTKRYERVRVKHEGALVYAEPDKAHLESDWTGVRFDFGKNTKPVLLKVAISFVDAEGARKNFTAEPLKDFESTETAARQAWNDYLGRWTVEGNDEERRKVFYTALYHTGLDPRNFVDADGRFFGMDHEIHSDASYKYRTVFSGWDVYRSQFPLLTLLRPDIVNDQVNTFIHQGTYGDKGMPEWEFFSNYWNCMLGDPAVSVIADAYTKGIRGYDADKALELCLQNANGPKSSRDGWKESARRGYFPGNISVTTENAYADFAIARLAEAMNQAEIAAEFDERGRNWRNTFDPEAGWMRRKDREGKWMEFDGYTDGRGVRESTTLQQSFFVPHDVPGLMEAMGGREPFLEKIDILFQNMPDKGGEYPYGKPWGGYRSAQYTHDNEPVHFVAFMFNEAAAPWLTQKWSRYIAEKAYTLGPYGLVGNDDVGQMSAWYVLAASGIHPVAPGDGKWQITSPEFEKVTIQLDPTYTAGGTFVIHSENWAPKNVYIQSATLNGQPLNRSYLRHEEIAHGGELLLTMGATPNKNWGAVVPPETSIQQ